MSIKLALVSPEGEIRGIYARAIKALDVQCDVVTTFKELYYSMEKVPYNGILIDLATKTKAPHDDLGLVENVLGNFPVLYLKWEEQTKSIKTYYPGQQLVGGDLGDFVGKQCCSFDARTISTEKRLGFHHCILLSKDSAFREGNIERTITLNVSEGGCFIFTNQEWEIRSNVWIIVKGISDESPIIGGVRWFFKWGTRGQAPGIGIKFLQIKEAQMHEICSTKSIDEQRKRRIR